MIEPCSDGARLNERRHCRRHETGPLRWQQLRFRVAENHSAVASHTDRHSVNALTMMRSFHTHELAGSKSVYNYQLLLSPGRSVPLSSAE